MEVPRGYMALRDITSVDIRNGRRVRMMWRDHNEAFDGVIAEQRDELGPDQKTASIAFLVKYDDGDKCWHSMHHTDVFIKLLHSTANVYQLLHSTGDAKQQPSAPTRKVAAPPVPPVVKSAQAAVPTAQAPVVTRSQGYDLIPSSRSACGYYGVSIDGGKFRANANRRYLGKFNTVVEAAVAVARSLAGDGEDDDDGEEEEVALELSFSSANPTGYAGVYPRPSGRGFYARALIEGSQSKKYIGGCFATAKAAAVARARFLSNPTQHQQEDEDEEEGDEEEEEVEVDAESEEEEDDVDDTFTHVDGRQLKLFPPAAFRGRALHLYPLAASGYLNVTTYYGSSGKAYRALFEKQSLGTFSTPEEAAYAVAERLGRPQHTNLQAISNGVRLVQSHCSKSGYLWVYDDSHKGYHRLPFRAETPGKHLGRYETVLEAAMEVGKYVTRVANPPLPSAASGDGSGGRDGNRKRKAAAEQQEAEQEGTCGEGGVCTHCGKRCKNNGALKRHMSACNSNPANAIADQAKVKPATLPAPSPVPLSARPPAPPQAAPLMASSSEAPSAPSASSAPSAPSTLSAPPAPSPALLPASGLGLLQKVSKVKEVLQIDPSLGLRDTIAEANGLMGIAAPAGTALPVQISSLLKALGLDDMTLALA